MTVNIALERSVHQDCRHVITQKVGRQLYQQHHPEVKNLRRNAIAQVQLCIGRFHA
jgi:hypothetical protein